MTDHRIRLRATFVLALMTIMTIASERLTADTGTCGGASITLPFVDVPAANPFFCSIAEAFLSGLSNGTDATHYSPAANVPREQMAAFVTRTMDQSLKRGSRRAALNQWWTPSSPNSFGLTAVGVQPNLVASDGADLWVANANDTVSRVRASDGKSLGTWTVAQLAFGVLSAKGLIFISGSTNPGRLYQIDPTQAPGAVTTVTSSLGAFSRGIAFDGSRIWTANSSGSVSIITLSPLSVSSPTTGFNSPNGFVYDGANMWVTDNGAISGNPNFFKLDASGAIIQSVTVGSNPQFPAFDGTNIWVPNQSSNSITVVRASTGAVLATLTGNGLDQPISAAFDGERILITNFGTFVQPGVSLWKADDLTPLGFASTGASTFPNGACSDGLNFWITFKANSGQLARF